MHTSKKLSVSSSLVSLSKRCACFSYPNINGSVHPENLSLSENGSLSLNDVDIAAIFFKCSFIN